MRIECWALLDDLDVLSLPVGCQIRGVAATRGRIWIYAEFEPGVPLVDRSFQMCGSHSSIPENGTYIGTAILNEVSRHVYEVTPA